MDKFISQTMKIIVTKDGIYNQDKSNFSGNATNDDYKIYILKDNKTIIYVGMTKQSIGDRFRGSFYAYKYQKKEKANFNGYSGYKWIEDYMGNKNGLNLFIYSFPSIKTAAKMKKEHQIEAIEAEIVYLVRSNGKQEWPKYQHEIHFHNIPEAKVIAKKIYSKVK